MYFGFRIPPEQISCDGCMAENPQMIDQSCPVRPCVIESSLDNCSQCEEYACARLIERLVVFEEIRTRINRDIPEDDTLCFIRPYENKQRLDQLRVLRKDIGEKQ